MEHAVIRAYKYGLVFPQIKRRRVDDGTDWRTAPTQLIQPLPFLGATTLDVFGIVFTADAPRQIGLTGQCSYLIRPGEAPSGAIQPSRPHIPLRECGAILRRHLCHAPARIVFVALIYDRPASNADAPQVARPFT